MQHFHKTLHTVPIFCQSQATKTTRRTSANTHVYICLFICIYNENDALARSLQRWVGEWEREHSTFHLLALVTLPTQQHLRSEWCVNVLSVFVQLFACVFGVRARL